MSDKTLKITSGILSGILLLLLLVALQDVPGGMILSGFILGIVVLVGILLGCIVSASLARLIIKKYSFSTLYLTSLAIAFSVFYYHLYSPTLKIIVPQGYKGQVTLVLSSVKNNILTVDNNGIGYINKWTFNHTYLIPQVRDTKGRNLNKFCVGFNPSDFWGQEKSCCISGNQIESLSFEIVPKGKEGKKQYYSKDLSSLVNKKLVTFVESD